jgi:serine/threonine protein phosphatase 1
MTDRISRPRGWIAALSGRLRGERATVSPTPGRGDPPAPQGTAYAVGDIHGRLDLLLKLEAMIRDDVARRGGGAASLLVFLGDYVDRGPSSRGVIEHLATRPPICAEEVFLRGNHEQVMLDFLASADILDSWSQFGGLETLYSYGLRPRLPLTPEAREELKAQFAAALPASHHGFLQRTRLNFETPTQFFVHAGINPQLPLAQQKPADLLWIRDEFLNATRRHEKLIIHGHTPVSEPEVLPNRINVDTGAYITGKLTCAVLEGSSCRILSTGR